MVTVKGSARGTAALAIAALLSAGATSCQDTRASAAASSARPTATTDSATAWPTPSQKALQSFLTALRFTSPELTAAKWSDATLLATGNSACSDLRAGADVEEISRRLETTGLSTGDALGIISVATDLQSGLCPDMHGTWWDYLRHGSTRKT
ncbi:DUF732 domain-containing protein [Streptomyces beijiangensis]|uniref:DUF732 domain-containing protein n=1 Tax=Streptomyces beijiangensis TaxID=163361 RepID=UPI003385C913